MRCSCLNCRRRTNIVRSYENYVRIETITRRGRRDKRFSVHRKVNLVSIFKFGYTRNLAT